MSMVSRLPLDHPYRWDGSAFGYGRLWRPTAIGSPLLAWYDAGEIGSFSFGTGVSQWRDLSGNGLHLDQSIGANQPIRNASGMNGQATVEFDGSNDTLLSDPSVRPWPSLLQHPFTVLCVSKTPPYNAVVGSTRLWSSFNRSIPTTNASWCFDYYAFSGAGNPVFQGGYSANTFGFIITHNASGVPYQKDAVVLTALVFDGAFGSHRRFYGDPVSFSTNTNSNPLHGLCLGADGLTANPSLHSASCVSEFMVVTGAPNTPLFERIEGYLAWKWRCQDGLIASHPFKNAPPTA